MRVATWNIRAGGGKRIPQIAEVILGEDPDLLVLTEYLSKPGIRLMEILAHQGYHMVAGEPDGPHNSICILSRHLLAPIVVERQPQSVHRWAVVRVLDLTLLALHLPNPSEPWNRQEFWDGLHHFATTNLHGKALIVGDLNAALNEDCEGKLVSVPTNMARVHESGWIDAWRHMNPDAKEYTWYSHRQNGFRIDHCLVSPALAPLVVSASIRHDVRTNGISDHSWVMVELNV